MKYCVLGAGLMGKVIAYDLLQQKDTKSVILADSSQIALNEARKKLTNKKLITKTFNADDSRDVAKLFSNVDVAIGAVHYKYNLGFSKVAIQTKTHFCDLGGNSQIVDEQLKLNSIAKKTGISIIPDCGLAPGMVSVLVKWGVEKFKWANTVKIRVGGLPQRPSGVLKYERLFSVDGLINEYIEPVRVLRNGEIKIVEPLTEVESINFAGIWTGAGSGCDPTRLEAFTTSGGTSTLVDTYRKRLKNLDYKTIRFSGHANIMRALYELGFFEDKFSILGNKKQMKPRDISKALFEKNIPLCKSDVTLVKIIFEGGLRKYEISIVDKATKEHTSMMRTTAFPISIIAQMQARKQIAKSGVNPQELCVEPGIFLSELKKREIKIKGI